MTVRGSSFRESDSDVIFNYLSKYNIPHKHARVTKPIRGSTIGELAIWTYEIEYWN